MIPSIQEVIKHYPEFRGVHPACLAVPIVSEEEFRDIVADIAENGLLEPLIRKDGLLIDGRTRLLACYESNTEIRVKDHVGHADPWTLVHEWNILRRHLTVGQRAMFADEWRRDEDRKAEKRHAELSGRPSKEKPPEMLPEVRRGDARDKVGERVGVSGKSVDKARTIKEVLPQVAEQVRSGAMSLESGYKEARKAIHEKASLPKEDPVPVSTSLPMVSIITAKGIVTEIAQPSKVVFNRTNDSVDWASFTWNPVTGCEHGCRFCYAREIAVSSRMSAYYPNGFEPTYHQYRLSAPKNTKKPDSDDPRDGRVFVCSMADLFGKWVPNGWISSVFQACLESPQWEYLFLTKWPARYAKMPLLEKAWYGASVIQQSDVKRVESAMKDFETPCVKWISLEPMLTPIQFDDLSWCNLVVIGAQTSTNQPDGFVPEFAPEFDWVVDVVNQCRSLGVPYYLKENLGLSRPGMKLPKGLPS
jgi:protein gp37